MLGRLRDLLASGALVLASMQDALGPRRPSRPQEHRDQYHDEITDDQIKELVASSAYDE